MIKKSRTLLFYRDNRREWRWRLVASNGNLIACSGEGYKRRRNAAKIALDTLDFSVIRRVVGLHA